MMLPAQQESFDLAILRIMDRNRSRLGFTVNAIRYQMHEFGFGTPEEDIMLERLDYLVSKKLAEEVSKEVHRSNRTWRITEAGIDLVDRKG